MSDPNHPLIRPNNPWAVTSYADLAETVIDRPGGRYAATAPVTASRLPARGWDDPSGPEPPLGYDINEVPDLGFMDVAPGMGAQASNREVRLEEALRFIADQSEGEARQIALEALALPTDP